MNLPGSSWAEPPASIGTANQHTNWFQKTKLKLSIAIQRQISTSDNLTYFIVDNSLLCSLSSPLSLSLSLSLSLVGLFVYLTLSLFLTPSLSSPPSGALLYLYFLFVTRPAAVLKDSALIEFAFVQYFKLFSIITNIIIIIKIIIVIIIISFWTSHNVPIHTHTHHRHMRQKHYTEAYYTTQFGWHD